MTSWADHAVLWHVYPLGFTGAGRSALPAHEPARHRLRQLERWLDYAVELGCNGLLLGPVFASESHGYDTTDHFRIDSRLGDEADFDALVAAADQRGMRLILDGVFNHVGRTFPPFPAAPHRRPAAPPLRARPPRRPGAPRGARVQARRRRRLRRVRGPRPARRARSRRARRPR